MTPFKLASGFTKSLYQRLMSRFCHFSEDEREEDTGVSKSTRILQFI
jgi:hypothetical protein